jgi:hypothetical protein
VVELTVNPCLPGKLVFRGTTDAQARTIINTGTITAANILGVVQYEDSRPPADYGDKRPLAIVRQGVIYVRADEAVTDGAAVTYGNTTGNLDEWGVTADANHVAVPGARWASTAGAGEIAMLEVGFSA